jgi:branched-chain amino acid transport system substrate-binding protein
MLFVRTMRETKYAPPILLANDGGFIDARFVQELGPQVQGVLSRDVWGNYLVAAKPIIKTINDMYKAKTGKDMTGTGSRAMQGVLVLADAINRARSTSPEAIRKALIATNLTEAQVIMPWAGVKFDDKGQNNLGAGLILELKGAQYQTVWPEKFKLDSTLPTLPFTWK